MGSAMHRGLGAALEMAEGGSCGVFSAAWKDGFSRGLAGASQSPWKHNIMIDRQSLCVWEGGHVAPAASIAITFPGGRGWVVKPKMSVLISMQLGSYHSAAAACHPARPLIHIETWKYYVQTHKDTHTSYCLSPPPLHNHIVPLSFLSQPFNHANIPPLFSSSLLKNSFLLK